MRFYEYSGDLIGLPTNEYHLNFRWNEKDCKILFSICRKGNALSCHFASDKAGLRRIKQAIDEFCEFLFRKFDWCTMVLAKVNIDSVGRLIKKCGFEEVLISNGHTAYQRSKSWVE